MMNAILFAAAFTGVLAAAAVEQPQPAYGHDLAMIEARDEPFMARGELQDPVIGDWEISVIGGVD